MKEYGTIYKIVNKVNGKVYVGQTTQTVEKRFAQHSENKRNSHIANAIKCHGKTNFEIIELASCLNQEDLNSMEVHFVKYFNSMYPIGYNHRAGGLQNGICSEEVKSKISIAKTGKPNVKRRGETRTQDQRVKISVALGGQSIVAVNVKTLKTKIYDTAHSASQDGHNPSNVISICKKHGRRFISKGFTFYYINDYANQNGSLALIS